MYKVLIKINENNIITEITSNLFSTEEGYIVIAEGAGDEYAHAQSNYLSKAIQEMDGKYNYKYVDGEVVELTDEEKLELFPPQETPKSELEIIKEQLELTTQTLNFVMSMM